MPAWFSTEIDKDGWRHSLRNPVGIDTEAEVFEYEGDYAGGSDAYQQG